MNIKDKKHFILDYLSGKESLIHDLIRKYSNDSDLGKEVRKLYFNGLAKYKKYSK